MTALKSMDPANRVLWPKDIEWAKEKRAEGWTLQEISDVFGVTKQRISQLTNRDDVAVGKDEK